MSPFLQLTITLTTILFAAKLCGYISVRLHQPAVLGELLVGIVLGPSLINLTQLSFVTDAHLHDVVLELGELGVLFLMFLAGLELHLDGLNQNRRPSFFSGFLGVVLPLGMAFAFGLLIGLTQQQALFLGITLAATSVSISAQTLMELKVLRSRVGYGLLGAAVIDDILTILLLSSFLALSDGTGGFIQIVIILVRMIFFLLVSVGFGIWVLPRLVRRISHLPISQGTLTFSIVVLLVYSFAAELLGDMAAITGAFIAGLMFSRMPEKTIIESGLHSLSYGFFVPIFFVSIGLNINTHQIHPSMLWVIVVVVLIAAAGKVLGSGLGAKFGGMNWKESLQLGVGMINRGEVGLIMAQVGLKMGILNDDFFTAIVGTVIITSIITPPLLRAVFKQSPPSSPRLVLSPDQTKPE